MSRAPASDAPPTPVQPGASWFRSEDWTAVWIGLVIVAGVLAGFRPGAPSYKWGGSDAWDLADLAAKVFSTANLGSLGLLALAILVLAASGILVMGGRVGRFLAGFPIVCLLAFSALVIAGNAGVNAWGLEYVIFSLFLGLFVGNGIGLPAWAKEAVRTEFYIKTGLVVLGTGILFGDILQAGSLGIVQAFLVVIAVWFFSFWLGRKLGVDDEFSVMLSTAVSICGVSAAIAACGAIQGDQRKLSYVTSLVLIVAVPMMIFMPWIIQSIGMSDVVGGAWLGGTLDTSGSVVAAGAMISEQALKAGVVVKFSQNVLIGVAALLLSIWWTVSKGGPRAEGSRVAVIWERFPKFVLGFLAASLVFSFVLQPEVAKAAKPVLESLRNAWFALAFVSIGLETRFSSLLKMENGRPALAFIGAQTFNVLWTLLIAYLLFGGLLFPVPELK